MTRSLHTKSGPSKASLAATTQVHPETFALLSSLAAEAISDRHATRAAAAKSRKADDHTQRLLHPVGSGLIANEGVAATANVCDTTQPIEARRVPPYIVRSTFDLAKITATTLSARSAIRAVGRRSSAPDRTNSVCSLWTKWFAKVTAPENETSQSQWVDRFAYVAW